MTKLSLLVFLVACGGKKPVGATTEPAPPTTAAACVKDGCSGIVCRASNAEPVITSCIYKPEYACYRTAACEPQADQKCGWTQTAELTACLANPPPSAGVGSGSNPI